MSASPKQIATACLCATTAAKPPVVVIPAYKPSAALPDLVAGLAATPSIHAVVIVNDGSGPEFEPLFASMRAIAGVHVLNHVTNLGKGAALKTGLNHAACAFPESVGVVTADADGQHMPHDIIRVAEILSSEPGDLILGVRNFGGNVPFRSKFGNIATRYVMRAATGQKISDTQTGLRGIPLEFVPELMRLRPNGYDFELEMLLAFKRATGKIIEIGIDTIYEDGNRSSHFNPLLDSMRIYFVFIRFAAASLGTAALDNLIFALVFHFGAHVLACQLVSRLMAGLFNYYVNKTSVFHAATRDQLALPRYWISVAVVGTISYYLIDAIRSFTGVGVIPAKICAETILFVFSFIIQRDFVFMKPDRPSLTEPLQRTNDN